MMGGAGMDPIVLVLSKKYKSHFERFKGAVGAIIAKVERDGG